MSYLYYRFYIQESEQVEPLDLKKIFAERSNTNEDLGLLRISLDEHSNPKSLSILCQSEEAPASLQNKLAQFLLDQKISIDEQVEHELLDEEEETHEHCDHHHHHDHHGAHHGAKSHWLKAALGLLWGAGLLILSLTGLLVPPIASYILTGLSVLMTLFLGHTVYRSAWEALKKKKWDMSLLYTISTLTVVVVSLLSILIPGFPMMLESAPLILGFWHLSEGIEHSLLAKINKKLDVRACLPEEVALKEQPEQKIATKLLIPNDEILIQTGEVIPVDGILTQPAQLYTTRIDGSPYLKTFEIGDKIKAGMSVPEHIAQIEMRVSKTAQNSYLALIAKNSQKAQQKKAPIERFANKILKYFIPTLVLIAALSGLIIGILCSPALAIQSVVSILVSACPCALSFITPMAFKIGINRAKTRGIHFKNGDSLQTAADITDFVFDLNGTLTQGFISVRSMTIDDEALLGVVALLENQSEHAVAKTISAYLETQGIRADEGLELTGLDKSHHSGIKALINGDSWIIGNQDMLAAQGITAFPEPYADPQQGSIYIVKNGQVIGQIGLTDPLRPDALATLNQLRALGKTIHLCTGADQRTAEYYGALLNIPNTHICANTVGLASDSNERSKTSYIKMLKERGCKVAMVGDAANDIPAINEAHLGIAVKSALSDVNTEEQAGIVLQQGNLFPIATACDLAKKTKKNIFLNLGISLGYNSLITLVAAGVFIALGLTLNPIIGIALMVLESTLVLLNLYRLKHQKILSQKPAPQEEQDQDSTEKLLHTLDYQPKSAPSPKQQLSTTLEPAPLYAQKNLRFFSKPWDPLSSVQQKTSSFSLPQQKLI